MELAGNADRESLPDGMDVPAEIARREARLKALAEAKAKIEARAQERFEQEQLWTAVRIRHQMAASIRNAKRFLFCRAVRCLLLMASMGGIGCVGRSPKGECRRTRRGSFQEGVTQESGCGRRRPTAEETGPTPA